MKQSVPSPQSGWREDFSAVVLGSFGFEILFTGSCYNHRMVWIGKDLLRPLSPTVPPALPGPLIHVCKSCIHVAVKPLQGWCSEQVKGKECFSIASLNIEFGKLVLNCP